MNGEWVSFSEIKNRVAIEAVLAARGLVVRMHRRGNRLSGPCPIHGGDNRGAFVVDRARNVWYCFSGCGRGGDVIELVRLLDNVSHREAALRLAKMTPSLASEPLLARPFRPFERALNLDPHTPWLAAKGILPVTARAYEAGLWRGSGMLAGCVAVRLHTPTGAPLGYAGRRLGPHGSKWVFPRALPKSSVLYGFHRADPVAPLVVVECPWGVMRLAQIGTPAVALLGTALSAAHVELLSRRPQITLLFDGDAAGRRAAVEAASRIRGPAIRCVDLPDGLDPDDLPDAELQSLLLGR